MYQRSVVVAWLGLASILCVGSLAAVAAASVAAIEYYDEPLDHYFITASQDEIVALNSGRFFGWIPTGFNFPVLDSSATDAASTPVCRFYGNPTAGLDSHFYSADPVECEQVLLRFPGIWLLESWNVFRAYLPDVNTGACPTGTKPVYRLWNHRPDVNHRYTDRIDVAQAMQNIGYVPEGYGSSGLPTAFCALASNVPAISCIVSASNSNPVVGSNVTLTATCTGNPTQYSWIGCTSSTNTCSVTSADPGRKTYVLTASNSHASSSPEVVQLVWQLTAPPPTSVTCSLTSSSTTPIVGSTITLKAACTGSPTSYSWTGCTSSGNTCTATSATAGTTTYSVSASNGSSTSPPTAISVSWQTSPADVSCSLVASNTTPVVGSTITLTAACTGNPTSYSWIGCTSSSSTCLASSATAGTKTYSVSASNGSSNSAPTAISVNWQSAPQPPSVSCTLTSSSTVPVIGSSIILTATCTGNPTSYSWVGCTSSSNTCVATSATAGPKTYSVSASNGSNTSAPVLISVVWLAGAPTGLPLSADFVNRASDPRGGDNAYNTFKRLPNGHGITFGGFSHDQSGNNAVLDYNPITDAAAIVVSNTPWVVAANVSGRSFLGNRDNQSTLVIDNKFWVMSGERGGNPVGNWRGILDPATWHWIYIDDTYNWPQVSGNAITDYENAAYGRIEALDLWYMFGGTKSGNPNDGLIRLERNANGAPYRATEYRNTSGNPSFSGSQKLAYVSQSHWDRGTKLHVYGGTREDWTVTDGNGNWLRTSGRALYEIDVQAPSMTLVSVNSLPDGQRAEGPAVFGYRDPAHDLAVVSDGKNVNVYSYALGAWFNVPVNTAADVNRQSPSTDGAGRQGFYSPEVDQFIFLGGTGHIYGLRLNYGTNPPPPPTGAYALDEAQVTARYWNAATGVAWRHFNGDWLDANGVSQGTTPWALSAPLVMMGAGAQPVTIDVTTLARDWLANRNRGLLLRGGLTVFGSRNNPDPALRPFLTVVANGQEYRGESVADSTLDAGTEATIGLRPVIEIYTGEGDIEKGIFQFDLSAIPSGASITSATFHAVITHSETTQPIMAFLLDPPVAGPPSPVSCTLAASNSTPTVGSSITLTATCTGGPTTFTWNGCASSTNSCVATSATAGSRTYSVSASNGTSNGSASVTVNWTSAPPPPPPPNPGNRSVTATAVPYTGPSGVLGAGKHFDFARLGNRWYKIAGDHAGTGSPLDVPIPPSDLQDGRQEILSFNVPANDWREDTPYYLPSSYGVQGADPDDAFAIVVGNEAWVMNTATNRSITQPAGAAQQVDLMTKICAYSPPSAQWPLGHWRVVANPPWVINGDRAWRGFLDPVRNRIIIPTTRNGAVWAMIDATNGADLTQYANGVPYQYGDYTFSVAGAAPDFTNRKFYVYDVTTSALYQVDMDSPGGATKVADLPEPPGTTQSAIKLTWHPDLRAVVIAATKIHVYEVDSGKLSTVARPDGFINGAGHYVPTSTIFFDPDTHDIVSIGTIDWDTNMNPGVYWRLKIQ